MRHGVVKGIRVHVGIDILRLRQILNYLFGTPEIVSFKAQIERSLVIDIDDVRNSIIEAGLQSIVLVLVGHNVQNVDFLEHEALPLDVRNASSTLKVSLGRDAVVQNVLNQRETTLVNLGDRVLGRIIKV